MVYAANNNSFSSRTCKHHKIGIFLNTSIITASTIYILYALGRCNNICKCRNTQ